MTQYAHRVGWPLSLTQQTKNQKHTMKNSTNTTTAPLPRIAINRDQFTRALFQPGGTFDGYIERKLKNGIRLFFRGETYALNRDNVFCLATKQSDGKTWYSYGGKINALDYATTRALADHIRAFFDQR